MAKNSQSGHHRTTLAGYIFATKALPHINNRYGGRPQPRGLYVRWGPNPLGPGHIVLDGDPAALPKKGAGPQFSAHSSNGWMHQDATWYGGRPEPGDCVLDVAQPPAK